jgi:hypothetical protein
MIECLADGQAKMNIAYLNAFEIAVKAVIQSKYGNFYARMIDKLIICRNTVISEYWAICPAMTGFR